jgi:hypothetical protein
VSVFFPTAEPSDHDAGDFFGSSVSITSGGSVLVGATGHEEGTLSGGAFVFDSFPPCDCPADTNDDGLVDVEDLVNVILAWGSSDPDADVNGDDVVDVMDLVAVILAWGPCPGESGTVLSLAEELEGAALDWPEDWDAFMENIDDENYQCWMHHYLTSPCGVLCPDPPDCPDDDPYF